ncbi:hypothetical protein NKH77_10140 [Streptomyces sp. M19]
MITPHPRTPGPSPSPAASPDTASVRPRGRGDPRRPGADRRHRAPIELFAPGRLASAPA